MHISCPVCTELFVATSDVFTTRCGHLFHYACLIDWFERSKSCPQCRNKTTENEIRRVYFNVGSNELEEDTSVLHDKIANLELQIHLKDTSIKNVTEENHTLDSQNKGLREEITRQQYMISAFQHSKEVIEDRINYPIVRNEDAEKEAYEVGQQLRTMRRGMRTVLDQTRNLKEQLRMYQLDLSAANLEKEKLIEEVNLKSRLNKQLEDGLQHLEHEKRSLQKKVYDLEKSTPHLVEEITGSVLQRPEAVRRPKLTDPAKDDSFTSTMVGKLLSPESKPNCQSEPQSPYLNMKSRSVRLTWLKGSQSVTQHLPSASHEFSTFNKPPCTLTASSVATNPEATYDCLGGHSKVDAVPVPTPKFKPPQKRVKYSGTSKTKKKITVSYK